MSTCGPTYCNIISDRAWTFYRVGERADYDGGKVLDETVMTNALRSTRQMRSDFVLATQQLYYTYCSCSLRANGPRESVYHLHLVHKSSRQILLLLLLLLLLLCARRRGGDAAAEKRRYYMPDQISFEYLWSTQYYSRISYYRSPSI